MIYLRGQSYDRQLGIRVHQPFEWRPLDELKMNFERPLEVLNQPATAAGRQKLILEYLRDEVAVQQEYKFKADQNRIRQLVIGSCRLSDIKLENILLDKDGHIILTDFGLSKEFLAEDQVGFLNTITQFNCFLLICFFFTKRSNELILFAEVSFEFFFDRV